MKLFFSIALCKPPTYPATAAQSAAAVMTVPSFRIQRKAMICRFLSCSVFRDHRTAKLEIKPDRHDRIGSLGGVGNLPVRRQPRGRVACAVVAVEVVVT